MVTRQPFDVVAFEGPISQLLRVVSRISDVCLLVGLLLWIFGYVGQTAMWLLQAGLVLLMAIPLMRVALTIVESIRMTDWPFLISTLGVAIILALTIAYALTVGG